MTTLTPTSEMATPPGASGRDMGSVSASPSMDESSLLGPLLNQMAAEFFSLVPGATSILKEPALAKMPAVDSHVGFHSMPSVASMMPTSGTDGGGGTGTRVGNQSVPVFEPAINPLPHAASTPVSNAITPPGSMSAAPSQYAAALPQVSSAQGAPSLGTNSVSSPFYFLQNDAEMGADSGLDDLVKQALPDFPGYGQDYGLAVQPPTATPSTGGQKPGANQEQNQIQQWLSAIFPTDVAASNAQHRSPQQTAPESVKPSSQPSFYFDRADQSYWDTKPALKEQNQEQNILSSKLAAPFDINAVRRDFPILAERVNGKQLVWFDNAATTQKPQSVIDRLAYFYAHENSNIHRAAHELAARATDAYETARNTVRDFLGAASSEEIIFVRGATEGINLVAQTFGKKFIGAGDEIIVSNLEHHANIVPWQQLAVEKGAVIRVIPVDETGQILLDEFSKLLNHRTKLVSITQVSNALGTVTPVKQVIDMAHAAGVRVMIDGAQAVSHLRVNVQALDADFYVFSGHKVFGPTGIGAVYGKKELLNQLPPWQGGGNMIADVTFERTQYQPPPSRFEAGTGNIADAVGLGAALEYVQKLGLENIALYEHALLEYATHGLKSIPGVRLIGTAIEKASVASFVLAGYETEEVGKALNEEGIAVRSGHHCAQPILRRFGVEATVRPSFAFYNTCEEIDRMIAVVRRLAGARQ